MHQNTFGGRDLSGPAVERIISPPELLAAMGGLLQRVGKEKRKGIEGEGEETYL